MQKEKEKNQKLMSEEYEKRLKLSRERVKEKRQKIIVGFMSISNVSWMHE